MDLHYIGVIEGLEILNFTKDLVNGMRTLYFLGFHNFDGDEFLAIFMAAQKYAAESSLPYLLHHLVLTEAGVGIKLLT
jgi:hypothetical protein